jgi:hypothetical protein
MVIIMTENKEYAVKGNNIYSVYMGRLNIEFKSKQDAELCCKLLNKKNDEYQVYIDKLDSILKWYKEYYGETILQTRLNSGDRLMTENKRLKMSLSDISKVINLIRHKIQDDEEAKAVIMLLELEKIINELEMGHYDLIVGSYTKIVKDRIE